MIINDKYKFCFIHIPKCAGTTVKNYLRKLDDTNGKFSSLNRQHQVLGSVDFTHIPLVVLKNNFPREYEKVCEYHSFAIIRDPYSRFASSLSQRLKMYNEKPLKDFSSNEIKQEIKKVVGYLVRNENVEYLPPEYIHFQRQNSYLYDDKRLVVKRLYTPENYERLLNDISLLVSEDIVIGDKNLEYANRSVVYRSLFMQKTYSGVKQILGEPLKTILPESMQSMIRSFVYVPRDTRLGHIMSTDLVNDFVAHYYNKDIELHSSLDS